LQSEILVSPAICAENGNYYSPNQADNCRSFIQVAYEIEAQIHYCPHGLTFDVQTCVCNNPRDTVCYWCEN